MKQQNSRVGYGDDSYNIIPLNKFPYITLQDVAIKLEIRKPRLSRTLRILQIPIIKIGHLVLLDDDGFKRVRKAIRSNEIKRGRKLDAAE